MRRLALVFCTLLFGFTGIALAQSNAPVPERRMIPEKDVDFYGADLRALFDTTYNACEQVCLSDPACQAFTFNTRSNACFPKSQVTERQPYEGALSATIVTTPPGLMALAERRAADLSFLRANDLVQARRFADGLARRHSPAGWTLEQLERGALDARAKGELDKAVLWAGPAIVLTDRSSLWSDYSFYAGGAKTNNNSQRRDYQNRSLWAAINAYLRAQDEGDQAIALFVMANALEAMNRGRDTIPVYRLSEAISPDDTTASRLDDAIAKYGFRITDHQVDSNAATPRICATFNEPLVQAGVDYAPYVQLPGTSFSVEPSGSQLCINGVEHGKRYRVLFRAGLPAASGEATIKDVTLNIYVRDRAPAVRFPGRAYVLPKSGDPALPIIGVNLPEVDLTLHRVSDRNLLRVFQDNYFGRPLREWEERTFNAQIGEQVWTGTGQLQTSLNEDVTTRLPMAEAIKDLPAGIYMLRAAVRGADPYETPPASQWFLISDLGLSTMSGADGLHVFVRSLASAELKEGVKVALLSRANRVLGEAVTDAQGYARFDPGLSLGNGGAAPAMVTVQDGAEDFGFLSLTDPEFDLSDRGVEGREPAGPIDLFLTTDRGAYRAGEVIYATALARDASVAALDGLPITAVLTRPDGVEYSRIVSAQDVAGGHVFSLPVSGAAPRGTWRLAVYADPKAPALANTTVLVEDFLPERIDFDLALPGGPLRPGQSTTLDVTARYLFGAPAGDLPIEGEVRVRPVRNLAEYPGYLFGRYDDEATSRVNGLGGDRTDDQGRAQVPFTFPEIEQSGKPMEATLTVRVSEGSGRPVERRLSQRLAPDGPVIGIKPLFDGVVGEGAQAQFQLIAVDETLNQTAMRVNWTLNRVRTRYQWYSQGGDWRWEPITTRTRVTSGEALLGAPVEVGGGVDWGRYELVVERIDGTYLSSAVDFYAGWYAPAETSSSPDTLELSLDKAAYRPGESAQVRIVPRYAGKAVITVVSNRLIAMETVEVTEGENLVPLPVTDEWGAGAYVTAQVIRPMDARAGRNPARSLGLSYASVDPGNKRLVARFDMPESAKPRGPLDVALRVEGIAPGETAYATIAAVDVGILNLTSYESPDPSGHYFGQRKLGVGMRDVYGRLIDGLNGAMGQVRSGGDAQAQARLESPPPTEELVAYFSGPVTVGADGMARVSFDLPSFNGTVKVMGVVWSGSAVGQAEHEVLVRDPVVITATIPRFLAPGDSSQALIELVHADGPTGDVRLQVQSAGLIIDPAVLPQVITLGAGEKKQFRLPVVAGSTGLQTLALTLVTPDGQELRKELSVPVQVNDPVISRTSRFDLAAGDTFTLSRDLFALYRPGTAKATVTLGQLGRMDAPGLLSMLDRYPYGCTEQTTSRALPLLYLDQVAIAMGMEERENIAARVGQAIERVLSRQASSGGFGLWRAIDGDFWLDAYVTDFLSRARAQGYTVPAVAFQSALDNLRNRVNYAGDFDNGGQDIAYALMVLAREGAANMGDLRYYADTKPGDFATPLAMAQLGAALALYGDPQRADAMFIRAAQAIATAPTNSNAPRWRSDYGTHLRDTAGVLTLAAEAGSQVIDRELLAARLVNAPGRLSTQEAVWSLLATNALINAAPQDGFTINGAPVEGPLVQVLEGQTLFNPVLVANNSGADTVLTVTSYGVPEVPEPASGNGYSITREYYTMEGAPADPAQVRTGTRMVVVLTVDPFAEGGARLMVNDPLPAGFEIDNPNLLRGGDIRQLGWLQPVEARHAEFRQERFLAAVDWRKADPFQLAYIVRAIAPGRYHHPAALVEDMYRPQFRAHTATGQVTVTP